MPETYPCEKCGKPRLKNKCGWCHDRPAHEPYGLWRLREAAEQALAVLVSKDTIEPGSRIQKWLSDALEDYRKEIKSPESERFRSLWIERGKMIATCKAEIEALKAKMARLPADWDEDSSLRTWFPFTAQELEALKAERDALKAESVTERGYTDQYIKRLHASEAEVARLEGLIVRAAGNTDDQLIFHISERGAGHQGEAEMTSVHSLPPPLPPLHPSLSSPIPTLHTDSHSVKCPGSTS